MTHDVIYVPGLGDTEGSTRLQKNVVKAWRLWGVAPHTVPMRWADKQAFAPKFERLLVYIDHLLARGHTVSLVGASAGASVVINAFAARPDISGVVLIAGKVNNPDAIGSWYRRNVPAFVQSAQMAQQSLASLSDEQKRRITSRCGLVDFVVPRKDSVIAGAQNKTVFGLGHAVTIASQLTFGAPNHIRFLKRLAK